MGKLVLWQTATNEFLAWQMWQSSDPGEWFSNLPSLSDRIESLREHEIAADIVKVNALKREAKHVETIVKARMAARELRDEMRKKVD